MITQVFGVSIEMDPSAISYPAPVLQKPNRSSTFPPSHASTEIEMKSLNQETGSKESLSKPPSAIEAPLASKSPNELETSRPSSSQDTPGVDVIQNFWSPHMNRFHLAAACVVSLGLGMNDSSSGALLA